MKFHIFASVTFLYVNKTKSSSRERGYSVENEVRLTQHSRYQERRKRHVLSSGTCRHCLYAGACVELVFNSCSAPVGLSFGTETFCLRTYECCIFKIVEFHGTADFIHRLCGSLTRLLASLLEDIINSRNIPFEFRTSLAYGLQGVLENIHQQFLAYIFQELDICSISYQLRNSFGELPIQDFFGKEVSCQVPCAHMFA